MPLRPTPPFPRLLRRRGARHPQDALFPSHQVLGNFHRGPGPLTQPWSLGRARRDPRSAPLRSKQRTSSHQFIQLRAAAFRCAPDSADTRPGIGGNQGLPCPTPTREIASRDPLEAVMLSQGAGLSPQPLFSAEEGGQ